MIALPIIDRTDGVQDAERCRACGGDCCQRSPGICHPDDLGPRETMVEAILALLLTGEWAFDN